MSLAPSVWLLLALLPMVRSLKRAPLLAIIVAPSGTSTRHNQQHQNRHEKLPLDLLKRSQQRHAAAVEACEKLFPIRSSVEEQQDDCSDAVKEWTTYSFPETSMQPDVGPPFGMQDLARVSKQPLLFPNECALLINETEDVIQNNHAEWVEGRGRYGTPADRVGALMPLERLPKSYDLINNELLPRIFSSIGNAFDCFQDPSTLRLGEARLVRYDASAGQVELGFHRDTLLLTANIALNDPHKEFKHGGTIAEQVSLDDKPIRLDTGHVLLHPGDVRHAAAPITAGKRYVLVLFIIDSTIPPHGRYLVERGEQIMQQANRENNDIDEKHNLLIKAAEIYGHAFHRGGRFDRGIFPWYYYRAGAALFADTNMN